ncbi:MAG: hypothetical protein ACP5OG_05235 [Candidatus Nanoarchaeia archaeon]
MKKIGLAIAIIVLVIWIALVSIMEYKQNISPAREKSITEERSIEPEKETKTTTSENSVTEKQAETNPSYSNSSSGGGSSGGSGGGSSSSSSSEPEQECIEKQVSYSITDFATNRNNTQINCSMKITNLDYELTGEFTLVVKVLQGQEEIHSETISYTLKPDEIKYYENTFEVLDSPETALCKYSTLSIPSRQICF